MPGLQVDAVLFDMDGTLIDESRSYWEAIRMTAEYLLGEPVSPAEVEEIKRLPGFNNDWDATWGLVEQRLHERATPPGEGDRRSLAYLRLRGVFQTYYLGDNAWRALSGEEPPFAWSQPLMLRETPLVRRETLAHLARFRLGIATSRPRAEALLALRQHGLDRFFGDEAVVAMEDAPHEKPDPAPLHELVRRLGSRRPVYIGDTVNDALASMQAGMPFIQVGTAALADTLLEGAVRLRVDDVNQIVGMLS